jgi:outer membrane immunogenic protein
VLVESSALVPFGHTILQSRALSSHSDSTVFPKPKMGDDIMKKILLAFTAFALLSGSALAADLPPGPMTYKAPPAAPVWSWTGFYLNAGGGYGLWSADTTTVSPTTGVCVLCVTQTQGGKGWFGTAGGGFDYQFSDHIVAGLLADYDFSSLKGTIQDQTPFFAGTIKENWSWAGGARIGWLVTPQVFSYFNGGYTETHFNSANMVTTFAGAATGFSTPAFSQGGWFLGGGVDATLAPWLPTGWFLRSEYRYSYFGTKNLPDTCPGVSGSAACGGFATPEATITFHPTVQMLSTSLVYKFNWMGH